MKPKNIILIIAVIAALALIASGFLAMNGQFLQGSLNAPNATLPKSAIPKSTSVIPIKKSDPQKPAFPLKDEKNIQPVELKSGNITVIVPKGYEAIGQVQLKDMQYCMNLIPDFLQIEPAYNGIISKTYITTYANQGSGSYAPNTGRILNARLENQLQMDLADVQQNPIQGFYANSSPTYCSNSHEFTHYVVDTRPIPLWANEGIAEYTQSFTQKGSKDYFECKDNGWYGQDFWGDNQKKLFPFSDLSKDYQVNDPSNIQYSPKWYNTAYCFWNGIDTDFGVPMRENILKTLGSYYNFNQLVDYTNFFINKILLKVAAQDKSKMMQYLTKFGFIAGKDY